MASHARYVVDQPSATAEPQVDDGSAYVSTTETSVSAAMRRNEETEMDKPNPPDAVMRERLIDIVRRQGVHNARAVLRGIERAGIPIAAGLAMVQHESQGQNIYGHDSGGTYSTAGGPVILQGNRYSMNSNIEVTPTNFSIFLIKIIAGAKSNGVGPAQVTYAGELPDGRSGGYFRQMLERRLMPWDAGHNVEFGCWLLAQNWDRTHDWVRAFGHYNGGTTPNLTYGNAVLHRMQRWQELIG
jgi:hypothetical protein